MKSWGARHGRAALVSCGALFAASALIDACAKEGGNKGRPPIFTTASSGVGGTGGAGGAGGAGGMPPEFPCGIDCTTIVVDACHTAQCNPATKQCEVVNAAAGSPCEDGLYCTASDTCQEGACVAGPTFDCGMAAPACYLVTCDEASKTCGTAPEPDGTSCTDESNLCVVDAKCKNGLCTGYANDCFFAPVPSSCHVAVCNPMNGKCEPQIGNEGLFCTDTSDLCSVGNTCSGGTCQGGTPKNCQSLTIGCNVGTCDSANGQCKAVAAMVGGACDDVNACTVGELCQAGNVCSGGVKTTACKNGDLCCPAGCGPLTDDDCGTLLAMGGNTSCALTNGGPLQCFGGNTYGALGNGTTTASSQPTPAQVSNVKSVTVGTGTLTTHTCVALVDGTARCFGYNGNGQLGNGTATSSSVPVVVAGLSAVAEVAAGATFSCALLNTGKVKCWGSNLYGQLGTGNTTSSLVPVDTLNVTGAVALATGDHHACALLGDGTVMCWGRNNNGQLGIGSAVNQTTPILVPSLGSVKSLALGQYHSCALATDGTLMCWGYNLYGQLGIGNTTTSQIPVSVTLPVGGATEIAAGESHTCAVLAGGTVSCWGYNVYGQLGDGTTTNKSSPTPVLNLSGATGIELGYRHSCAVWESGVKCWGYNISGQLGDGTTANKSSPVTTLL